MVEFLSDEWIAAFDELLRGAPGSAPGTPPVRVVHTVTGGPDDRDVEYAIVLSPDGNAVRRGPVADATVTFTCDLATAVSINRGDEQTQSVFLDGRLRVGGDTAALLAARPTLTALGDVAAPLRQLTSYPTTGPSTEAAASRA